MDLSLGKLQQLVMVARTGSFSKAAIALNISQPALSRSIAAIEDRYGFQIFNRLGHGVELTAAGSQVVTEAEPLLQSMRVFDNNLRLFGSGQVGRLEVGISPLLASELLARFASEFFAPRSSAQLRVMIRPGDDLLGALKNDAIEIFFFPEGHVAPHAEIDIEQVGAITPACVVRAGHPLASQATVTIEDLADFPWGSSIDPPLPDNVLSPARFVCDNFHILSETVRSSDLICIFSSTFVAEQLAQGTLREIRIGGFALPSTPIYVAKLRGRIASPLAVEAIRKVRQYLARTQA